MSALLCRQCGQAAPNCIATFEDGALILESVLCKECVDADGVEDEKTTARPADPITYGDFAVLPGETLAQYIRRVFPELAEAMYNESVSERDFEFFRLGITYAFARETYDRQTFVVRRTPQQIIDEFLAGLDFNRGRNAIWFPSRNPLDDGPIDEPTEGTLDANDHDPAA